MARAIKKPTPSAAGPAGKLRVLAVGIDGYENDQLFPPLTTRANDARAVLDCFRDVHQLGADKEALVLRSSATAPKLPTRNALIGALTELSRAAAAGDRLLFYFSGYGVQRGADLFLVPQDAYDDDADALVSLARVGKVLAASAAQDAFVLLDLEPETAALAHPAPSPNPKLSVLTHWLSRALRGQEPDALDAERRLTAPKLEAYLAERTGGAAYVRATHSPVLGDFAGSILDPATLDAKEALTLDVHFEDSRPTEVTEILTKIRNWSLSESQIEHAANGALPEYLAPSLGKLVPVLRRAMGFSQGTVVVEGAALRFPGGAFEARFVAESKRSGRLVRTLTVDGDWLERSEKIPKIVETVGLDPEVTRLRLRRPLEVGSLVAGLEASGWTVVSELPDEIRAERLGTEWTFRSDRIEVRGMQPVAMFARRGGAMGQALAVFGKQ